MDDIKASIRGRLFSICMDGSVVHCHYGEFIREALTVGERERDSTHFRSCIYKKMCVCSSVTYEKEPTERRAGNT